MQVRLKINGCPAKMVNTNTEQEMNERNRDDGSETEYDDADRELNFGRMRKCKQCRRYTYGHNIPYGPNCTMEKKSEEEIDRENRETLKRRRLKEKKTRRITRDK